MSLLAEIQTDPRTGLRICEIPLDQMKYFADLKGSVIHWFGHVTKYNQKWATQTRVCIISDRCIYLCHTDGGITRCIPIITIQQAYLSAKTAIGFKVALPDYDLLIAPSGAGAEQQREEIFEIVERIYYSLTGEKLPSRRLVGGGELAEQSMQNFINLKKPDNFRLHIEPLGTISALTKKMTEKRQKENEDRRIVEEEFERVRQGLVAELANYREVEYSQMQAELERREKLLRERDMEIAHIKETCVSLDDPEVWRKCPNCKALRRMLEAHPSDDKQKVFRLQRDVESQRHIVQHLQAALLHRNIGGVGGAGGGDGSGGDASKTLQLQSLQQQLEQAKFKNRELQQLIVDSRFLTSDVKHQALQLAFTNPSSSSLGGGDGYNGIAGGGGGGGSANSAILAQKDREIQHLKTVLKDATFKHLQELEQLRRQIGAYDAEVASYVARLRGMGAGERRLLEEHTTTKFGRGGGGQQLQQHQQLTSGGGGGAPPRMVTNIADAYSHSFAPSPYPPPNNNLPLAPSPQNFITRSASDGVGIGASVMSNSPFASHPTNNNGGGFGGGNAASSLASPQRNNTNNMTGSSSMASPYYTQNSAILSASAAAGALPDPHGGMNTNNNNNNNTNVYAPGSVMGQSPSLQASARLLGIDASYNALANVRDADGAPALGSQALLPKGQVFLPMGPVGVAPASAAPASGASQALPQPSSSPNARYGLSSMDR